MVNPPGSARGEPPAVTLRDPRRMLREIPYTGLMRVLADAAELGHRTDHPDWRNLGQGQPEVGPLPGAPPRLDALPVGGGDHAYAPVAGLDELRDGIADHYNRLYRAGAASRYTAENVAITAGGRTGLARVFTALGPCTTGCFSPDYPAYVDLFRDLGDATARAVDLSPADGFALAVDDVAEHVAAGGLDLLLLSNPGNPTGRVLADAELSGLIEGARRGGWSLLLDEFYSHYVYGGRGPVSAAAHVEDVDKDPVLLLDGLTKNFRYPGWRIGWVLGPRDLIDTIVSVGSYLDGGASRLVQRAALEVLEPERARQETDAIRAAFELKRDLTTRRLAEIGMHVPRTPEGTFYVFASTAELPPPLDTSQGLFRAALERQVLLVPGEYFDMAAHERPARDRGYDSFVRVSFGSPLDEVVDGLDRLEQLVAETARGRPTCARASGTPA